VLVLEQVVAPVVQDVLTAAHGHPRVEDVVVFLVVVEDLFLVVVEDHYNVVVVVVVKCRPSTCLNSSTSTP
jgi:hypothetical protein